MNYTEPRALENWKHDQPDEELYEVAIMDDETVVSSYGRYAHGSGCKIVTWNEFLSGQINELVSKTMGKEVLDEVLSKLRRITYKKLLGTP